MEVPRQWAEHSRLVLDKATLADPAELAAVIDRLHRVWMGREPIVLIWDAPDDALAMAESITDAPWTLDAKFLFPHERLRFLAFTNNYDGRDGELRWWWSHKASRRLDAIEGGPADVILEDGSPAWIDGGPRRPLEGIDQTVIHGESADMGLAAPVPPIVPPSAERLADDQLAAVAEPRGAARVIAPAGSGKTRTLAARLRHLVSQRQIEPLSITAVAYNTRAAEELRQRLGADRATVRTIHSLGWAILNDAHPGLALIGEPQVRSIISGLVSVPRRANSDPIGPYLEGLDQVRAGLTDPELVEAERDDVPGFASMFEDYRKRMYGRGRVDHGEQVYGAIEALLRDPELRARWQARCRHVLVDEFQDLTPAYLLLIRLVASPQLQVFGVGDDDQVIYGYAGADPGFLIDYDAYFPGAELHALETNYRCPPAVVEGAAHLLSYNHRRIDKSIRAAPPPVDIDHPRRPSAPLDLRLEDGNRLAESAADLIAEMLDGECATTDIAVLTRVNSALIPVKAALIEHDIPTSDLLTHQSLQRTTLRALFSWLRLVQGPDQMDRHDVLEAVRRPARGLTGLARELVTARRLDLEKLALITERLEPKQADRWARFVDDLAMASQIAAGGDAVSTLAVLVDEIGLAGSARTLDAGRSNASRSSHLDDLIAVRRAAAIHPRLDDFESWLRDVTAHHPQPDGVTLSSIHRVKGMEWRRVIVFGADRGAMPHELSTDTEEERRVFHVSITRATDQTVVLADAARPSRFTKELDGSAPRKEAVVADAPRSGLRTRSSRHVFTGDQVTLSGGYAGTVVAVNGSAISVRLDSGAELIVPAADIHTVGLPEPAPSDSPDAQLVEALKVWRRETCQRLGVPAYVVLHDATIEAIAARRPASERALISVPGIGASKLEQYGDDILELVAASG